MSKSNRILRILFWESTIRCNLGCAHCRRLGVNEDEGKDLSTVEGQLLIEQIAGLGKSQDFVPLLIFSGGEPLCRGDLFELVGEAKKLGIKSALATNGTLVDEEMTERIVDSGVVKVSVSLDGAAADVHDKFRGEGSFKKAILGIGCLRERRIPFQINMTLTKHNAEQLEDVCRLCESLGAVALHIFMLVPVGCGQELADTDMLSAEQVERKMVEIYRLSEKSELELKVTCGPQYQRVIKEQGYSGELSRGCLAGSGVLFVSHSGDVFPCGYLPVKCGNVLENELSEIWNSSEQLLRMCDSSKLEGKCGVCDYKQVCGGCRGRAYAASGNYMGAEPLCAYVPD